MIWKESIGLLLHPTHNSVSTIPRLVYCESFVFVQGVSVECAQTSKVVGSDGVNLHLWVFKPMGAALMENSLPFDDCYETPI